MDLADLRLLDAVAVHGSFTAAAAQLRLSQPSVSTRIAAVEPNLSIRLDWLHRSVPDAGSAQRFIHEAVLAGARL
jgi:hypothetical protein